MGLLNMVCLLDGDELWSESGSPADTADDPVSGHNLPVSFLQAVKPMALEQRRQIGPTISSGHLKLGISATHPNCIAAGMDCQVLRESFSLYDTSADAAENADLGLPI
jgi:hypothetical protein